MRYLPIFLLAPVALAEVFVKTPVTGGICCDSGVADPTETCSKKGLNAYCCSSRRNDYPLSGGCDRLVKFTIGREVLAYAEGPTCNATTYTGSREDTIVGFIGCAEL
ncbi:hypothetical protein LX36DRAFT_188728 [Colletotrichum falcatum]|nr:hypothetical protein LX36DRAFT_188728 [Colletotrichum falcatum]